jgi:hypothetical protein
MSSDSPHKNQNCFHTEVRDMSITHANFIRSMKPLKKYYDYIIDEKNMRIIINDESRQVQLNLGPEKKRHLGSFWLPKVDVEFVFSNYNKSELEIFWQRFELSFRRGGG